MLIPVCQYGKRQTRILSDAIWGMQINTQKSKRILSKIETGTARNRKRRKERERRRQKCDFQMKNAKGQNNVKNENWKWQTPSCKMENEKQSIGERREEKNWKTDAASAVGNVRQQQKMRLWGWGNMANSFITCEGRQTLSVLGLSSVSGIDVVSAFMKIASSIMQQRQVASGKGQAANATVAAGGQNYQNSSQGATTRGNNNKG